MTDTALAATPLERTAMFGAEVFVPGASRFVAGDVGGGLAHLVAAGAVAAVVAPTMPLVGLLAAIGIRANSLFRTTAGRDLWESAPAQSVVTEVSNFGKPTPTKSSS